MIKLVISDLDGTLLNEQSNLTDENINAIAKLRDKGIMFTIATGRAEQLIKEYLPKLKLCVPAILYNGSIVLDTQTNNNLFEEYLNKTTVSSIASFCEKENIIYLLYTKEAIYSKPNYRTQYFQDRNKTLPKEEQAVFKEITNIASIIAKENISKILLIEDIPKQRKKLTNKLQAFQDINITYSQSAFIDINPLGINKGQAVQFLKNHLGLNDQEIVVLGDQDNDLSMFKQKTYSIAMGNAIDDIKKVANVITKSNSENGFAYAVDNYILPNKLHHNTPNSDDEKFMLTNDFIKICKHQHNFYEGIRCSCKKLLDNGYITKNYVEKIVDNAKEYGSYIVLIPHVAVPHSRPEDGSLKKGFSISVYPEPIEIDGKIVEIMVAVSSVDNDTHLQFLKAIAQVFKDKEKIKYVLSNKTKEAVLEVFGHITL